MKPIIGMILAASIVANVGLAAPQPPPRANRPPSANTALFQSVEESTNVAWLENIAQSLTNAQTLAPPGGLGGSAKDLRAAAYARLGALATAESLAAVARIEQQARGQSIAPRTVPLGIWAHPCWHYGDSEVVPLAQTKTSDGRTYAVLASFASSLLGAEDLFLISTTTPEVPASWFRPVLVPKHGQVFLNIQQPRLKVVNEDLLEFTYFHDPPLPPDFIERYQARGTTTPKPGEQRLEIRLSAVLRDTDQDGWTDLEEQRLGLDPNKSDTDGDGLADGMDPCPNYAPTKGDESNEDVVILQKAVFATFGLSGARHLLIVQTNSPKAQIWGYAGPIIFQKDSVADWWAKHGSGGIFVSWSVTRTGDEAQVRLSDYEGSLAAGTQDIHLKKIRGKWIVVRREFGKVS
jgi:hypothetical protein